MSLGWIIVVILGFVPLALVFFSGGGGNQRGANGRSTSNKRKTKQLAFSGWRIVLTADTFLNIDDQETSLIDNSASSTVIQQLVKECDVFVVAQVNSDKQEDSVIDCVRRKLGDEKSLVEHGLNENKILFCETEKGVIAIARQIEPDLFVGTNSAVVKELARFLPNVSQIDRSASDSKADQGTFSSLTDLFASLGQK